MSSISIGSGSSGVGSGNRDLLGLALGDLLPTRRRWTEAHLLDDVDLADLVRSLVGLGAQIGEG